MDEITGPKADALIAKLVSLPESVSLDSKRVSGKMVGKALETLCAFANTSGGTLALGLEDRAKAQGMDRLYGLAENPEAVDELRRKTLTHLLPAVEGLGWLRAACRLRNGTDGHILLLIVPQSPKVHSILDDGTWTRLDASNREMTATEITELSYRRGVISAESEPVVVPFDLLETDTWRRFATSRGFLSGDIADRLHRIGLCQAHRRRTATGAGGGAAVRGRAGRLAGCPADAGGRADFPLPGPAHRTGRGPQPAQATENHFRACPFANRTR